MNTNRFSRNKVTGTETVYGSRSHGNPNARQAEQIAQQRLADRQSRIEAALRSDWDLRADEFLTSDSELLSKKEKFGQILRAELESHNGRRPARKKTLEFADIITEPISNLHHLPNDGQLNRIIDDIPMIQAGDEELLGHGDFAQDRQARRERLARLRETSTILGPSAIDSHVSYIPVQGGNQPEEYIPVKTMFPPKAS